MVYSPRIGPDGAFIKEFKDWKKRIQSLESKPAGKITIRETLTTEDPETGVKTILGQLPDGSYGIQPFVYDITPPPVSTAPVVVSEPGLFIISWDGLFSGAADQPRDFECCNIIGHKIVDGSTTLSVPVGMTRRPLDITYVSTDVASGGETWQFSLEAEDYNGNRAAWSTRSAPLVMQDVLSNVEIALTDLQAEVDAVSVTASAAQTAAAVADSKAVQAASDALAASNLAGTKGKVLIQPTAPTGADANSQTLWIDTTGGANTPRKWVSGTTWTAVTDKVAVDAASAAVTAQTRADQAFNSATSAATAAGTAQTSADSKNRVWYQTTAPAGSAHKNGDTWFDTDDGNRIYLWTGSSWADYRDTGITAAQTAASAAQTSANGKNKINYQTTMPAGGVLGDTWFDTDDGNKIYVHNGTTFVNAQDATIAAAQSTANTKTKTFVQGTAPTATTQGDIWIDTTNGNVIKTWEGSAWVTRPDAAIAAAQTAANTAQTAANGKNKVYYQTAMPTGGTYIMGDTWFDTDDGNKIYVHNGTTFTASALGASAIADLAITNAKIADATIQSAKIGSVDAGTITVGTLDADRIAARAISVDKLNIGSVDNLISEPTFLTGGSQWLVNGGAYQIDPTGARNGGPAWKIVNAASQQGTYNKPERLRAEGGQSYRVLAWVKSDVAIPASGVSLYITTRNSAGTTSVAVAVGGNSVATPANTWVAVSGTRTLPSDAIDVSFGIFSQSGFSTGNLWVDFVSATRMATGELIVDGAIQAGSAIIGTGAIGTAQIANLAVTDAHIAAATITSAKIANLDAAKITSGTIDADRIGVATLTADKVIVGTGNNLAYNGSAEIAASTKGYSSFTRTITEVPPGFGAAWQSAPVQATVNFLTYPAVPVKPQTRYKLNVWVKADKAGSVVYLEPMTGSVAGGNRTNPIYAFSNAAVPTVWTKWSVEFTTGLSSTNTLYFRWFLNHVNGTVFDSVFSFTGFTLTEMNAGELIVDGSIKTNHMTAGTIDASILTAGSITAPKIAAKSITTDKLVISSTDNLVVGADFSNTAASWQQSANIIYQATGGRGATTALRFTGSVAALTSLNLTNRVTVEPDNRFRCSVFVKSSAALAIDKVRLVLRCYTTATAYTDIIGCSNVAALVAATWTQVKGISPTLPAGTIAVEFYLSITNPATGTTTDVDYASATRAFDGNLVVDGAIDGQTITGATVQTADTGARIVLDQTSLNAWNTAGDNYFNMSNATGVNISSVGVGGFDVTRINYCTNPSFEVDISGWTSAQTVIRDTTQFYTGIASIKATHTATADRIITRKQPLPSMTSGDYTTTAYVRHNAATAKNMRAFFYWTDINNVPLATGGTFGGTIISVAPNTWTRVSVTTLGGQPGGASNLRMDVSGIAFTSAETMWVDAVLLDNVYSTVNPYFDGSTVGSGKISYVWEGTSGLSYSDQRTDRDIKIKTGGNDVLLPGNQFSKQAVGIGFIPLTPYTQTAGLFSNGQVVSLIEGASDPQLTRLDLGNQKISTWSYGDTSIQARGRIYLGSSNVGVSLNGPYVELNGTSVEINNVQMTSMHAEFYNASFAVAGGNAGWDIGPQALDSSKSTAGSSAWITAGPFSGAVQILQAGYYTFSCIGVALSAPGQFVLQAVRGSDGALIQQNSTPGYFWETSVTTAPIYITANDYIRFGCRFGTAANISSRVYIHKHPF